MANVAALKDRLMSRGLFDKMPGVRAGTFLAYSQKGVCWGGWECVCVGILL